MKKLVCVLLGFLLFGVGQAAGEGPVESRRETGPVTAIVRLTPEEPRLGDPLELELVVKALPGVEVLMPEFAEALGRFSITDFVPTEGIDEEGRSVFRQRYVLQSPRSGQQSIPPLLVEFIDRRQGQPAAPQGEEAYELETDPLSFDVSSVLAPDAPQTLRAPKGPLSPRVVAGGFDWVSGLGFLGAGLLALLCLFFWWFRRGRARLSAYQVARQELDDLLYGATPGPDEMDAFYVGLSGIVRRYIESRFGLRSPELTTEEFFEQLTQSPDLLREQHELLDTLLTRADLVKFAHETPDTEAVEESISAARRFIEETGTVDSA